MRLLITRLFAITFFGLPIIAVADPIVVTYDITSYGTTGFSASWIHAASGCGSMLGPDTGDNLYRCGSADSITGSLTGTLDGGVLTGIYGSVTDGTTVYNITGGQLGGAFVGPDITNPTVSDLLWFLDIAGLGTFHFESMTSPDNGPNQFNSDYFVLWGQNTAAYNCDPGVYTCGDRHGIDLYGVRTVPEPGTLALFGVGLLGLGLARRRRVGLVAVAG